MSRPAYIQLHSQAYQKLVADYLLTLLRLGYRERSARGITRYVAAFLAWLEGRGVWKLEVVESAHLVAYQRYLSSRPNHNKSGRLSEKSIYTNLQAVQGFFARRVAAGQAADNPAVGLVLHHPREHKPRAILSRGQIEALYQACQSRLEVALLSLVYGCGLRAAELEALNVEHVLLREGLLIVARGKGNKRRVIPMSKGVVSDLVHYYESERPQLLKGEQVAFMLHTRGGRLRAYTANKYLRQTITQAVDTGLLSAAILRRGISLHSLRHSIATHLLEQGVSVEQVRRFLGHSQLETTQVYTHISSEQLEKLIS